MMTLERLAEIKEILGRRGVISLGTEREAYHRIAPELLAEVERLRAKFKELADSDDGPEVLVKLAMFAESLEDSPPPASP